MEHSIRLALTCEEVISCLFIIRPTTGQMRLKAVFKVVPVAGKHSHVYGIAKNTLSTFPLGAPDNKSNTPKGQSLGG